jgi:hypothetical protein
MGSAMFPDSINCPETKGSGIPENITWKNPQAVSV